MSVFVLVPGELCSLERTLESISVARQRNVAPEDYEVTAVPFEEALRLVLSGSVAPLVGFIDGAPIVTPRLIEHAIAASRLFPNAIVGVPEYEIGTPSDLPPDESRSQEMLSAIDGGKSAYDLFGISRFARTNERGYLVGMLESAAFFCTRRMCENILAARDGAKLRTPDDIYARLLGDGSNRLVVLGGEGSFRQIPASVTAPKNVWFRAERQPTLFGVLSGQSQDFFAASVSSAAMHHALAEEKNIDEWPHDHRGSISGCRGDEQRSAMPSFSQIEAVSQTARPRLSVVVVAYKSPRQIENTLYSLSARHQWNVREEDYEIIVVENQSSQMLGEERAVAIGSNVRYFLRSETGVSPAPALNFGVSRARAEMVGLMIDGARMATPRVVEHALLAATVHPRPIVVVPGYHLGPGRQHITSLDGYDESAERDLLDRVDWKRAGYRLFEIGCFDEATKNGFLNPILEATYLFTTKACFDEIGGLDERFDLAGGGEVNHDLFDRLCRSRDTRYIVLWGEGNFHQYHGGVSTSPVDRERKLELFRNQYDSLGYSARARTVDTRISSKPHRSDDCGSVWCRTKNERNGRTDDTSLLSSN
jgi:glycosyltransferase involved in cell wall biosynthesis